MPKPNRKAKLKVFHVYPILASWLGLSMMFVSTSNSAATVSLLVPAYAHPCCDEGRAMWSGLAVAAQTLGQRLHVILNPASGPGQQADAGYFQPLRELHQAGAKIYGYIPTQFGDRDPSQVAADVDHYVDFYPGWIDGFFIDEMSNDLADTAYYLALRNYVKVNTGPFQVIANPGTPFIHDSSGGSAGFEITDFALVADLFVSVENTAEEYRRQYISPPWGEGLEPTRIAHLIHSTAEDWDPELLDLALQRGAGVIYLTDDILPNPYDRLPSYWDEEVAAASPVPLPSGLSMLISGLGLTALIKRKKGKTGD